jgi:phosphoglycerate dehydrogenase-like enzyme
MQAILLTFTSFYWRLFRQFGLGEPRRPVVSLRLGRTLAEEAREEMVARPLIVIDPQPRSRDEIFEPKIWARLEALGELAIHEGPGRMPAERFEPHLPEVALLIGQSDMRKSRLDRASKLRAILNAETNFLQNVDDDVCFERGIHVLAPGSAFAKPVAKMALGMAIDLCRGMTTADRAMRRGQERWLLDGAEGCFSLYCARMGLIGFGDLARAFTPLLAPFGCPIKAYDPWVSNHFMAGFGVASASLEEVLKTSQVIVVFAAVTSENRGFLGKREFEMIAPGSVFLLMSRAGRGRFPRVSAPSRERPLSRRDRRLSA